MANIAKVKNNKVKEEKIDLSGVKDELKDFVSISVKKAIKEELEVSNKRLIREKNKKILFRNLVILALLIIIGLLLVFMYKNRFFDEFLGCNNSSTNNKANVEPKKEIENVVTLEDLKREFAFLLNDITIHEESEYLKDFYEGKLNKEIKNYIAFNNLDFSNLGEEDGYNIFSSSLIRYEYEKLFDSNYENASFNYLGNKVRYLNRMDSYITDQVIVKKESNIKREIIDISVDGGKIEFTCIEGVVKDDHLFNVLNKKEIKYKNDDLSKYEKELTKVVYTFIDGKLNSIN